MAALIRVAACIIFADGARSAIFSPIIEITFCFSNAGMDPATILDYSVKLFEFTVQAGQLQLAAGRGKTKYLQLRLHAFQYLW